MGNLKGKFKEQKEFTKYFGVVGVRIVTDSKGVPIINPTNEQLSKIYEDYNSDNEREYIGKQKVSWGWDDLKINGGNKRISETDYSALPPNDREGVIPEEEIEFAKVSILIETLDTEVKVKKLLTFKFLNAVDITKNGDKKKVFNKFGKFTYLSEDGTYGIDNFESSKEDMVTPSPMSTGHLDFEDLVNFLYAYSTLSKKEYLLDTLDLKQIMKGNVQSISNIVMDIHADIRTIKDIPAYGAILLMTVENNNSTSNEFRQSYYHIFERLYMDNDLRINNSFNKILKELAKERKPNSNGITYSPESKGIFVGHNGIPKFGLAEFKNSYASQLMSSVQTPQSNLTSINRDFKNPFEQNGAPIKFS